MQSWLDDRRPGNCHGDEPMKNGEEMSLCRVGSDLYEKVFKHYTKKQWNKVVDDGKVAHLALLSPI